MATETTVLGLDVGSNSVGWALLKEHDGIPSEIIDLGSRIFIKAVEEKTPIPKNQKRRQARLARRVLQRRVQRKQRLLNYLVSLDLLPQELQSNNQPECVLNAIGDPYALRAKALDEQLTPHEFGRVLLHFVARRGFLSSKKQLAGDLVDDPDAMDHLQQLEEEKTKELLAKGKKPKADDQSEDAFFTDITQVYEEIKQNQCRTLGEYLHQLKRGECKRNRSHDGGHLRTERKMYQQELQAIWEKQQAHFTHLPDNFMADNEGVKQIIFYQRPLRLRKNCVGKCLLEHKQNRANMARLEFQRCRYLQAVNNLKYGDSDYEQGALDKSQRNKLIEYSEHNSKINVTIIKKELGLANATKFNLETKDIKGNTTACKIREIIGERWNEMSDDKQKDLFEDLFTIKKKSALKKRLLEHWKFDNDAVIQLCLLEFEPGHANLSLKAINKLLPHLEKGMSYNDACQAAGYDYAAKDIEAQEKLPAPAPTANPIVNKGLHELKRVVNAVIKEHGKPDAVRIEMAHDLEMNTTRYKDNLAHIKKNQQAKEDAQKEFDSLNLDKKHAELNDKIKYRLWKDQKELCAYSNKTITMDQLFTAETEIDHILPYKKSLDNSYMNKVICFTEENGIKKDRTPIDAWGEESEKWNQLTQAIKKWGKSLKSKVARFYQTESDLLKRDSAASSLNDTRYISREAKKYVSQLGCDVSVTKGIVVSEIRHQWGFNTLIGEPDKKERTDHRHHAIDAVVIAATSRGLYNRAIQQIKFNELDIALPYPDIRDELQEKLNHITVSHAPQRKLSGALHEETGAGYIAKHGGLVYRKALNDPELNPEKIVDTTVKDIVKQHISAYSTKKEAFAEGISVYHKDGKTPIHRVRILQSTVKTTKKKSAEDILSESKFGVKDKQGEIFKWLAYGNNHHVEIIRHKESKKISGEFVTMMEAHRRAMTGTKSAIKHGISREPIIKANHGERYEFIMALHINDTVSVTQKNGEREFYRVQKLSGGYDLTLRLHSDASPGKIGDRSKADTRKHLLDNQKILENSLEKFIKDYQLRLHKINAIGIPLA